MDRYEAIKIFIQVAELESFTQAAEALNIPRPTVSTSVQSLETLVNAKLLHRTTRHVKLTPEGLSFLERCKDLLSDFEEAEAMFRNESTQLKGKVRVDMVALMAKILVLPHLAQFLDKHPGLEIELSSADRRVDMIREGIDCAVRGGGPSEAGVVEKNLGSAAFVNCASPTYLKKYGKPKNIEDLKNHKLIAFTPVFGSKPGGFEYFDGEQYREAKMSSLLTVNSTDSYTNACLLGLGISQDPFGVVQKYLQSGELIEVLPKFKAEPMPIKLVYPQRRSLSKRARVFMDWLEPLIKDQLK